jgi:hypothetical protein
LQGKEHFRANWQNGGSHALTGFIHKLFDLGRTRCAIGMATWRLYAAGTILGGAARLRSRSGYFHTPRLTRRSAPPFDF